MDKQFILNVIGYVGSALVLMSFLMASVLKLRLINIAGSIASTIYSLLIHAYPTVVMNAALIIINVYYILKILKKKNIYHVVETRKGSHHLAYFFEHYKDDISKYFPRFTFDDNYDVIKFLYCEETPASVFCAKRIDDNTIEVFLDYATPSFRDCSAGKYIYENLKNDGIKKVVLKSETSGHEKYMEKLGFKNVDDTFIKEL